MSDRYRLCNLDDTCYHIDVVDRSYGVGDRRNRKTTELTFVTFVRHDLFLVDVEIVLFDHTEQSICNSTQRRGFHDWIFHTTRFLSLKQRQVQHDLHLSEFSPEHQCL